jgi:hypothetical protein
VIDERELRAALRDAEPPDEGGARERAWDLVRAAYGETEPARRRRGWKPIVAAGVATAVAVVGVAAASAPDSGVGRWVRNALDAGERTPARPALGAVPGGGRLLVESGGGAWAVASDGGKRRLGSYAGASWSPHGRFVVAWRGRQLTAIEPTGGVRWSRAAPRRIRLARWGRVDGFRIAYLAGAELRIVNGDGTGDRGYARANPAVAPAWRPDAAHVLAYVDRRGRIDVAAVDARRRLWRSAPLAGLVALAWSADGARLTAATRDRVIVFSRAGRRVAERAMPTAAAARDSASAATGGAASTTAGDNASAAAGRAGSTAAGVGIGALAASTAGRDVAIVRHDADGRSAVVLLDARLRARTLFTGPGRLGAPAWSPDGRSLLVPWPEADQWLFLRARAGGRLAAVANVAAQFMPGASNPPFPGAVEWCCARDG